MERGGVVYILTNGNHSVYYTGVTSDLASRMYEHKNHIFPNSFSAKYKTYKLVYFETFHSIEEAIYREKQIKKYRREKKLNLIQKQNPDWKDLSDMI